MKINEAAVVRQQVFQALSIATNAAKNDELFYKDNPEGLIGFMTDCIMASLSDVILFEEVNLKNNHYDKRTSDEAGVAGAEQEVGSAGSEKDGNLPLRADDRSTEQ